MEVYIPILISYAGCILLLSGVIIYWLLWPFFTSPYIPSSSRSITKMLELADLNIKDRVIDLGSGDGRLVISASRLARSATGVELNPYLTILSKLIAILSRNGKVLFKHKNMFKENLSQYDVVFCYLLPRSLDKLKYKFEAELIPGSKVITNSFRIRGWKPKQILDEKYYLYVMGEHK